MNDANELVISPFHDSGATIRHHVRGRRVTAAEFVCDLGDPCLGGDGRAWMQLFEVGPACLWAIAAAPHLEMRRRGAP